MLRAIKLFLADQSGAAAVEYGLLASSIAMIMFPSVQSFGNKMKTTLNEITGNLH